MAPLPGSMSSHTRLISISVAVIFILAVLVLSFGPSPSQSLSISAAPETAPTKALPKPSTLHHISESSRRWLIATPMAARSVQRRMILRNTWQRFYRDDIPFVSRFVVSRVDDVWKPFIRAENETYGDIIELPHLEESSHVANTIKSVEFFTYLTQTQPNRWDLVTKLDDDSFLDARAFWNQYLQPALAAGTPRETTWGRTLRLTGDNYTYAGGQFYTLTSDLVKSVAELYSKHKIDGMDEDVLVSRLMYEGGVNWNQVDLPSTIAFDYNGEDLLDTASVCPWAQHNADMTKWAHSVGPESLNPHKMKTDEDYLKVAACWDDAGNLQDRPTKS